MPPESFSLTDWLSNKKSATLAVSFMQISRTVARSQSRNRATGVVSAQKLLRQEPWSLASASENPYHEGDSGQVERPSPEDRGNKGRQEVPKTLPRANQARPECSQRDWLELGKRALEEIIKD